MGTKGKAIYEPKGKAAEYAPWACNFFTGCSNDCAYCYCKRGVLNHTWSNEPKLKKSFKNEEHALKIFGEEMSLHIQDLQRHGLFFSFTTDPLIPGKTMELTWKAVEMAVWLGIPVKILTKRTDWLDTGEWKFLRKPHRNSLIAFGFTLTGCDDMEPGASTNRERILAMPRLHDMGFQTFASIEPVIKIDASYAMINSISGWCDLIMIGLLSGKKEYDKDGVTFLYEMIKQDTRGSKFYLKESFVDYLGLDRSKLSHPFVTSNYNIFKQNEEKI